MQHQYVTNHVVRTLSKKLMALAMMPRESVIVSFQQIREDCQSSADLPMASLLNYFENTWLSDVNIWNVYRADSRTNNICEGNEYIIIYFLSYFYSLFKLITVE